MPRAGVSRSRTARSLVVRGATLKFDDRRSCLCGEAPASGAKTTPTDQPRQCVLECEIAANQRLEAGFPKLGRDVHEGTVPIHLAYPL